MWLYQILDILGTLLETLGLYVLVKAYCLNIKNRFANFIPPALFFVVIYIWTWFIEDVTFRLPVVLILTFFAYKIVTRESAVNIIAGIMTQAVCLTAANTLAETISFHTLNEMTVMVGEKQFLKPQVYILYFLLQIIFMLFFYHFMKKHKGGIDKKSLLVISIFFFIVESLMQNIAIAFHEGTADWFRIEIELVTIVVAMLMVVLIVYIKNYLYLREQEQRDKMQIAQLQQQYAYYQDKLKDEERIRSLYHDMKNHLLVLENRQNTEETRQMARQLRTQIMSYEDYIHTGNDFLDIIIKDKAEKARTKQIDFSATIDFDGVDFIDPLDISTFFGNGLDNAIEASEKLPEEERVILIKAGKVQNFVSILIENNCMLDSGMGDNRTTKADEFLHGFGISNMQKAAEKYAGTCTTSQADGKFTLKILLPISKI